MPYRSLFWPVALIVIAAATTIIVMMSSPATSGAREVVAAVSCPTNIAYPIYADCVKTQTAEVPIADIHPIKGCPTNGPAFDPPYPPFPQCEQTRTALLLQTQSAGASATPTTASSGGGGGGGGATATPTATFTSTPTAVRLTATPSQATTARAPVASATPTATLPSSVEDQAVGDGAILCVPGQTITVEGSADPNQALIVTFADRPVGGGFSRGDGSYSLRLRIGDERPGVYAVHVEERLIRDVVRELKCQVPAFTPTPTPPVIP